MPANPQSLQSERIMAVASNLVSEFNGKFPMKLRLSGTTVPVNPLRVKDGGRVWTRGDGTRYRDWAKIVPDPSFDSRASKRAQAVSVLDQVWARIEANGVHLQVSGEFGSDGYTDAFRIGGTVFKRMPESIWFGSASRLKNASVWRSREPEETSLVGRSSLTGGTGKTGRGVAQK